jgi:hypothetical protein
VEATPTVLLASVNVRTGLKEIRQMELVVQIYVIILLMLLHAFNPTRNVPLVPVFVELAMRVMIQPTLGVQCVLINVKRSMTTALKPVSGILKIANANVVVTLDIKKKMESVNQFKQCLEKLCTQNTIKTKKRK